MKYNLSLEYKWSAQAPWREAVLPGSASGGRRQPGHHGSGKQKGASLWGGQWEEKSSH